MKVALIAGLISIAAALPFNAFAAEPSSVASAGRLTAEAKIQTSAVDALIDQELQRQELDVLLAPIKSSIDMDKYLREMPKTASPIERLSPSAKTRFLDSLTFNASGITGYRYDGLVAELSASEIYKVLSLFGAQHTTSLLRGVRVSSRADKLLMSPGRNATPSLYAADHEGYRCESKSNCYRSPSYICMSGC